MYKEMMDWMRPQQKTTTKHPSIIMRERNHRHFHSLWDLYSYNKKQKDTRSLYFAVVYKVEKIIIINNAISIQSWQIQSNFYGRFFSNRIEAAAATKKNKNYKNFCIYF